MKLVLTSVYRILSLFSIGLPVLLFLPTERLSAQREFPYLFTLDSRSADTLFTPDASSDRHRYRVTAWGTYSMWEDTVNSSVDPVWIYSFPDEEWAKPEWRIFTEGFPIYVGDNRMFDSHGLRVDDSPFPRLRLNDEHRYSMIIDGTGEPISVAIVDWNFKGLKKQDAHDNNSGYLRILVEELPLFEADLCAIDSSNFPRIRISMNVLRDSVRFEDLETILAIYENGATVKIDSVDCDERTRPVSVSLVVDRSGSMSEAWGNTTRLDKVKESAHQFVSRLIAEDEASLITFGTDVTFDQPWTSQKRDLHDAINRIEARGYTAMNDAVDRGVGESALRSDVYRRAVVLLSDGEDNISQIRAISTVIERAVAAEIPVFTIGLLFDSDDSLRLLSSSTGGRHFSVSDPGSIDSVFSSIAEILFEKGCCNVWYTTPAPAGDGTWRNVETVLVVDGDSVDVGTGGYRAPSTSSGVEIGEASAAVNIGGLAVRVVDDFIMVTFYQDVRDRAVVQIVSSAGEIVVGPVPVEPAGGRVQIALPAAGLASGLYFLHVTTDGGVSTRPVRVLN
jgi:VWFA-related protein